MLPFQLPLHYVLSAACASAALTGVFTSLFIARRMSDTKRRQLLKQQIGTQEQESLLAHESGLACRIIALAQRQSSQSAMRLSPLFTLGSSRFLEQARFAGLAGRVTVEGLCKARLLVLLYALALFGLVGAIVSPQMMVFGVLMAFFCGIASIPWALGKRAQLRKHLLERHLSEALEVICLGLRSGLSFDYALQLYCQCFETMLSQELSLARQEWRAGLRTREEALRRLADTYDSPIFTRVVENIVRAMRFGSPLAESLEVLAAEARQSHKAAVEEKVMKAPVKMMLPVGTLILPSMLILVLGPVLLDLVQGF